MLKVGHRGACGTTPENTLTAFKKAIALGADGVELDVHLCKSGELIVIHDDTVDRTTNGHGAVAELTLAEIRVLRIEGGEHVPTLEEALDVITGAYCFIEIKHPGAALAVARLIAHRVKQGWPMDRLWLISFHHGALTDALKAFPSLYTGASFEKLTVTSAQQAHDLGARAIMPHHGPLTHERIDQAQALGLKVICWTVNEPSDITRLQRLGVDGIMSDYPERLGIGE